MLSAGGQSAAGHVKGPGLGAAAEEGAEAGGGGGWSRRRMREEEEEEEEEEEGWAGGGRPRAPSAGAELPRAAPRSALVFTQRNPACFVAVPRSPRAPSAAGGARRARRSTRDTAEGCSGGAMGTGCAPCSLQLSESQNHRVSQAGRGPRGPWSAAPGSAQHRPTV